MEELNLEFKVLVLNMCSQHVVFRRKVNDRNCFNYEFLYHAAMIHRNLVVELRIIFLPTKPGITVVTRRLDKFRKCLYG